MAAEFDIDIDEEVFLPCYRHLVPNYREDGGFTDDGAADINLLWGGRDSGKSHFIAQRMVIDCLIQPYFRCLLIKKTANSIKESQWQTIKDVVEEWGLEHLFEFKTSPLEIVCANGNRFIARGCDEPKKLKSLRNYNYAWLEEGNQLDEADFISILTTLRSNAGDVKIWLSFNPETEEDYEEFWLYRLFFSQQDRNIYGCHFTDTVTIKTSPTTQVSFRFTSTHTTYKDNLDHVTPLRQAFHESLSRINPHYYLVFTEGKWATMKPGQLWAFAFDERKHLGTPTLSRQHEVWLSFDFNRNPICCTVIQHYEKKIRVLETIKLANSSTPALCDHILLRYPRCLFKVTGDATGRHSNALVEDNLNHYAIIQKKLKLSPRQFVVPTVNPDLKDNAVLVNAVLSEYDVEIHATYAQGLIFDFKHVRALPDGTIDKGDRKDPKKQADALDTWRYWCNVNMKWLLKDGPRK